jgi:hypothetical protein
LAEGEEEGYGKKDVTGPTQNGHNIRYVGFEVLTVVTMNSAILWAVMPYSSAEANRTTECYSSEYHTLL